MNLKNIFLFNHLLGTQLVTVFYWVASLITIINAVTVAIPAFRTMTAWHLLLPQLLTVAGVLLFIRLICEMIVVVFRMQSDTQTVREKNDRAK